MGHTKHGARVECRRCGWRSFRRKRFCECEVWPCTCSIDAGFGLCRCGAPMVPRGHILAIRRAERARADLQRYGA
jgi:hypothetical protein